MENINKIQDFVLNLLPKPINEIKEHCKILGEGTSRLVIKYNNKIAIKIAKNEAGHKQNKAELNIYKKNKDFRPFIAEVYKEVSYNRRIRALIVKNCPKKVENLYDYDDEWRNILKFLRILNIGDRFSEDSYRISEEGKLVLVDYGMDKNSQRYYGSYKHRIEGAN